MVRKELLGGDCRSAGHPLLRRVLTSVRGDPEASSDVERFASAKRFSCRRCFLVLLRFFALSVLGAVFVGSSLTLSVIGPTVTSVSASSASPVGFVVAARMAASVSAFFPINARISVISRLFDATDGFLGAMAKEYPVLYRI